MMDVDEMFAIEEEVVVDPAESLAESLEKLEKKKEKKRRWRRKKRQRSRRSGEGTIVLNEEDTNIQSGERCDTGNSGRKFDENSDRQPNENNIIIDLGKGSDNDSLRGKNQDNQSLDNLRIGAKESPTTSMSLFGSSMSIERKNSERIVSGDKDGNLARQSEENTVQSDLRNDLGNKNQDNQSDRLRMSECSAMNMALFESNTNVDTENNERNSSKFDGDGRPKKDCAQNYLDSEGFTMEKECPSTNMGLFELNMNIDTEDSESQIKKREGLRQSGESTMNEEDDEGDEGVTVDIKGNEYSTTSSVTIIGLLESNISIVDENSGIKRLKNNDGVDDSLDRQVNNVESNFMKDFDSESPRDGNIENQSLRVGVKATEYSGAIPNMELLESDISMETDNSQISTKDILQSHDSIEENSDQQQVDKNVQLDLIKYLDNAMENIVDSLSPKSDTQAKPLDFASEKIFIDSQETQKPQRHFETKVDAIPEDENKSLVRRSIGGEQTQNPCNDGEDRDANMSESFRSGEEEEDVDLIQEESDGKDLSTNDEGNKDDSFGEETTNNEVTIYGIMKEVRRTESELKEAGTLLSNDRNTNTYPYKPYSILQGNVLAMEFDEGSQDSVMFDRTVEGRDMGVQAVTLHHKITYGMEETRGSMKQDEGVGSLVNVVRDGGGDGNDADDGGYGNDNGEEVGYDHGDGNNSDDNSCDGHFKHDSDSNDDGDGAGHDSESMEEGGLLKDGEKVDGDDGGQGGFLGNDDGNRNVGPGEGTDEHSGSHKGTDEHSDSHDGNYGVRDGEGTSHDHDDGTGNENYGDCDDGISVASRKKGTNVGAGNRDDDGSSNIGNNSNDNSNSIQGIIGIVKGTDDSPKEINIDEKEEEVCSTITDEGSKRRDGEHSVAGKKVTEILTDVSHSGNTEITKQENVEEKEEGELSSSSDEENPDECGDAREKRKQHKADLGKVLSPKSDKKKSNIRLKSTVTTSKKTQSDGDNEKDKRRNSNSCTRGKSSEIKDKRSDEKRGQKSEKERRRSLVEKGVDTDDRSSRRVKDKTDSRKTSQSKERKNEKDNIKTIKERRSSSTSQKRYISEKEVDKDSSSRKVGTKENIDNRKSLSKENNDKAIDKKRNSKVDTSSSSRDARSKECMRKPKSITSTHNEYPDVKDPEKKSKSCGKQRKQTEKAKGDKTSREDQIRHEESGKRESRSSSESSTRNLSRNKEKVSDDKHKTQVKKSGHKTSLGSLVEDTCERVTRRSSAGSESSSKRLSKSSRELMNKSTETQSKEKNVEPNRKVSKDSSKGSDRKSVSEKSSVSKVRRSSRVSVETKGGNVSDEKKNNQEVRKEDSKRTISKTKDKTDAKKTTSGKKPELVNHEDSSLKSRHNSSVKRQEPSLKKSDGCRSGKTEMKGTCKEESLAKKVEVKKKVVSSLKSEDKSTVKREESSSKKVCETAKTAAKEGSIKEDSLKKNLKEKVVGSNNDTKSEPYKKGQSVSKKLDNEREDKRKSERNIAKERGFSANEKPQEEQKLKSGNYESCSTRTQTSMKTASNVSEECMNDKINTKNIRNPDKGTQKKNNISVKQKDGSLKTSESSKSGSAAQNVKTETLTGKEAVAKRKLTVDEYKSKKKLESKDSLKNEANKTSKTVDDKSTQAKALKQSKKLQQPTKEKLSGKRKREDTPGRFQKVRKTIEMEKNKESLKFVKTKEAKLPGNVATVRILKVDRGKALVLKRRHVNQMFIRGDNIIMVAYENVGTTEVKL